MFNFSFLLLVFIPIVYFINRRVFRERNSFLIILSLTLIFAFVGIYNIYKQDITNFKQVLYWFLPLYSLLLYRLMLIPFWMLEKRDPIIPPREIFYTGKLNILADRIFGIVYLFFSLLIPYIFILN